MWLALSHYGLPPDETAQWAECRFDIAGVTTLRLPAGVNGPATCRLIARYWLGARFACTGGHTCRGENIPNQDNCTLIRRTTEPPCRTWTSNRFNMVCLESLFVVLGFKLRYRAEARRLIFVAQAGAGQELSARTPGGCINKLQLAGKLMFLLV